MGVDLVNDGGPHHAPTHAGHPFLHHEAPGDDGEGLVFIVVNNQQVIAAGADLHLLVRKFEFVVDVVAQGPDAKIIVVDVADGVARIELQCAQAGGLPVLITMDEFIGVAADFIVEVIKRKAEPAAAVQFNQRVAAQYARQVKADGLDVVHVGMVDKFQALILRR